jgi:hypothetical protein
MCRNELWAADRGSHDVVEVADVRAAARRRVPRFVPAGQKAHVAPVRDRPLG